MTTSVANQQATTDTASSSVPTATQPVVTTPTSSATSTKNSSITTVSYGDSVNQKDITWNGNKYSFIQYCKGTNKTGVSADDETTPIKYCLGTNTLTVQSAIGTKVIETDIITDPSKDVYLLDASLIPSTEGNGNVLVTYGNEPCVITDDACGVGVKWAPSYSVNLKTNYYTKLNNYPFTPFNIVWNPAGTKAIVVPVSCGGAGCGNESLQGYDLTKDQVTFTSTQKASDATGDFDSESQLTKVYLPYWNNIVWQSDSNATANIIAPDGSKQTIQISF